MGIALYVAIVAVLWLVCSIITTRWIHVAKEPEREDEEE